MSVRRKARNAPTLSDGFAGRKRCAARVAASATRLAWIDWMIEQLQEDV